MSEVKQEVQQFYDQVGWKLVGADVYQNARYEDLRPVAREYIHKCHMRVSRHLSPSGRYLLDAGSGPVQYPEYLEYSRGYDYRVCADISFTALQEARKRLTERGLYVVADVANLPFKPEGFDGVVSLHTIHHLQEQEHLSAYSELYRVLAPGKSAVVVNGWARSRFMNRFEPLIRFANSLRSLIYRLKGQQLSEDLEEEVKKGRAAGKRAGKSPRGTFTNKHNAAWVRNVLGKQMPVEILVWRSVTVRFMRALIHPHLAGRFWLRRLYALEEKHPHYFGENGKYPLIVIRKPEKRS
jgi:SAM-dependent methyltransferase